MVTKKRLVLAAAITALMVVLLAVFAAVVAPRLLDSRSVRDAIQREVSSRTGGDFTLESVQLELLPLPRVKIASPGFSRGASVAARAESIVLYPRIFPLLKGNFKIARLRVAGPTAELTAAPTVEADKEAGPGFSPETAAAAVGAAIAQAKRQFPDLSAVVDDGALVLTLDDGSRLRFGQIEAKLSTEAPRLELSCRSDLWDSLRVSWDLDEHRPPGRADITVSQLRPARIVNRLLPESGPLAEAARVDLAVEISPGKDGRPRASFSGDRLDAVFRRHSQRVFVSADAFDGSLRFENDRFLLAVDRWQGKSPGADLSAVFVFAAGDGENFALRDIRVQGAGIDLAAIKAPVLFFSGGRAGLDVVFDVLRAGQVENLRLEARIPGLQRPFAPKDFRLEGQISDGAVHIPGIDLDLTSVAGKALIEHGLLTAKALEAVHRDVAGTGGNLTLSLFDGSTRFGLDIRVDAGLSDLPATLARLIDNPSFSKGAEAIRSLEGRGQGRLVLGDSMDDIRARVEVDQLSAVAALAFLPKPVELSGRNFSYEGASISAGNLDLSTGGATFAGVSGRLQWEDEPMIELSAAAVDVQIDPVMAWLPGMPAFSGRFADVSFSGGELRLSTLGLSGPLRSPARWQFDARGDLTSVRIQSARLPAPVAIDRLSFQARPDIFQADAVDLGFLDAVLSGSGMLTGTPAAPVEASFSVEGQIGTEADRWLLARFKVPQELALKVHRISDAKFHWKKGGFYDLSGDLLLNQGMRVSTIASIGPDHLDLKRLTIEDGKSNAEASFQRTVEGAAFSYNGRLFSETVDHLVRDNRFLHGRIMGGFRGRIDFDAPARSTMEGRLEIEDLFLPSYRGLKTHILRASVFGEGKILDVERLDFTLDDSTYRLSGRLIPEKDAFAIDMALSAEKIDLNRFRDAFSSETGATEGVPEGVGLPITGTLALNVGKILYDRHRLDDVSGKAVLYADRLEVEFQKATLCGIAVPGAIRYAPESMALEVRPAVTGGQLSETGACLFGEGNRADGRFSLQGTVAGKGKPDTIVSTLQGGLNFSSQEGLIRESVGFNVLRRVLALVNITEVFAGSMPDFSRSGFRYNSIKSRADIEEGTLFIREMVVDGKNITLTAQGSVDLVDKALDLTVLVAPLKTVDRIVGKIPLVSDVLNGTLVSIPVQVRGTLDAPEASFMSPQAVGSGLIRITEQTLRLPLKLIHPSSPNGSP
jgi:hypothetical protein